MGGHMAATSAWHDRLGYALIVVLLVVLGAALYGLWLASMPVAGL